MAMRDKNTDNNKHGPAFTKAQASVQMPMWPTMGAWKPPGQTVVPASTPVNDDYQAGERWDPTMADDGDMDDYTEPG